MDERIKFSYSLDGERYHGTKNNTFDECVREALKEVKPHGQIWVGVQRAPMQPEYYWDADDWLEHVSCQEDYSGDCADDWDISTKDEQDELNAEVREVLAKWLDRHGNRPQFWIVENPVVLVELNGDVVPEDGEENIRLFTEYRKTVVEDQLLALYSMPTIEEWEIQPGGDKSHLATNLNWRKRIVEDLYVAVDTLRVSDSFHGQDQQDLAQEAKVLVGKLSTLLVGGVPRGRTEVRHDPKQSQGG